MAVAKVKRETCRDQVGREGSLMRKQATIAAANVRRGETVAPSPTAPAGDIASTVLALVNSIALSADVAVEKLDRVVALYERVKAKDAELQYNAAKGRILKKLADVKIVKNRST